MKTYKIVFLLLLGVTLSNCSGSDSNSSDGTLFVEGNAFNVGTNTAAKTYNIVYHDSGSNYWQFHIIEDTEEGIEPSALELVIEAEGTTIDGTYILYDEGQDPSTLPASYAVAALNTPSIYYYKNPNAPQTITVTDMGNHRFRLQYNDVTLTSDDGLTSRTLTGYCQPLCDF